MAIPRASTKNWAGAEAGPGRDLDDICLVDWGDAESFRRERASWLRSINRVGDIKLGNMVWLLHVLAGFMKHKNDSAWPSIARLEAELGWSEASVKRALALAVEWGWLIRDRRYATSNRYLMSFSKRVRAEVDERYEVRVAPFLDRSVGSNLISLAEEGGEIKPDPTVGSNLISQSDQTCAHSEIKPDPRYHRTIPLKDTVDPYLTDRLGETSQDESQGHPLLPSESPSLVLPDTDDADEQLRVEEETLARLGEGDISLGIRRAALIGAPRVSRLAARIGEVGMIEAADEIIAAIKSAREIEAKATAKDKAVTT